MFTLILLELYSLECQKLVFIIIRDLIAIRLPGSMSIQNFNIQCITKDEGIAPLFNIRKTSSKLFMYAQEMPT